MKMPTLCFVYDRRRRATKSHPSTVEIRITYECKQKYLTTGVRVLPKEWKHGMVTNRVDAQQLNQTLQTLLTNVTKIINDMMQEGSININEIGARLKSMESEGQTFIDFCEERAQVRKYGRAKDSKERYDRFMRFFTKWGKIKYFRDITDKNVLEMDQYVTHMNGKTMKNYSKWQNYHRFLNSFILDAIAAGLVKRNPYKWVNIEKDKDPGSLHKFLTLEEFHKLQSAKMPTECLEQVRDLFVFQTYTCMAYKDLANFDLSRGTRRPDGRIIYTSKRGKTGEEFTFLVLKLAMAILNKYNGKLPMLSNVNYNKYLKVVAQAAGIDKQLTTHWARHTGATILLNEGIDMETVAKILGHSSTRITRSTYAKLLDSTVADKMLEAEEKLGA